MSKQDIKNEAGDYLKKVVNWGGGILIVFLLIFLASFFITQCTQKNYTNSLSQIEAITTYKVIDKSSLESAGQIKSNLDSINTNNEMIRNYLDNNVKSQFENVGSNVSSLNNQIANLYTILNNSLMIISIILGLFTLIIAVFGFYISNVITVRYKEIKQAEISASSALEEVDKKTKEVEKLKDEVDTLINDKSSEIFDKFIKHDTDRLIKSLQDSPINIANIFAILALRKIEGEENWRILKQGFISLNNMYEDNQGHYVIASYAALIFQFYPEKIICKDQEIIQILKNKLMWAQQISFTLKEIISLIRKFTNTEDDDPIFIFVEIVIKNHSCLWHLTLDSYKEEIINVLKNCSSINEKIRIKLIEYRDSIANQIAQMKLNSKVPQYNVEYQEKIKNAFDQILENDWSQLTTKN